MIENYILELLRSNDCVIVPGFGGFLTHRQPARILAQQREIAPPKTGIIFNRGLDRNDGLLSHYLADKTKETFRQAQARIDETVNAWKNRLNEDKNLEISGIGSFSLNDENKWQFAPADAEIQIHKSFGLTNVQLFPAGKAEQKTLKLASHDEHEIKTRRIGIGWIYGGVAAAAIIMLAFLLGPQIQNILRPTPNISYSAKVAPQPIQTPQPSPANNSFLEAVASLKANADTNATASIATSAPEPENTNAQPTTKENSQTINTSQGEYYVIGGSFLKQKNAKKFARLLEKKGYKSRIIHNSNGFFNVSFVQAADSMSASQQLNKLKIQENQQAWILKW